MSRDTQTQRVVRDFFGWVCAIGCAAMIGSLVAVELAPVPSVDGLDGNALSAAFAERRAIWQSWYRIGNIGMAIMTVAVVGGLAFSCRDYLYRGAGARRFAEWIISAVAAVALVAIVVPMFTPMRIANPWPLFVLAGAAFALAIVCATLPKRRRDSKCACGYDLRHTPGRCPECGKGDTPALWRYETLD